MVPLSARAALAALLLAAFKLGAQGSPYVPLDDIAYRYVDVMMARGEFRSLSALERPYTVRALLTAIDSARATQPSARISGFLDALEVVVNKYSPRPRSRVTPQSVASRDSVATFFVIYDAGGYRWADTVGPHPVANSSDGDTKAQENARESYPFRARGTVNFYGTAQTSARRELMLAADANTFNPAATIRVVMAGGPIAASIRPIIDTGLNEDIEFTGRRDRSLAGRTEDGYVTGQWTYGELFFGRTARNWGPATLHGLQLGNYVYTYDHLYGRVGTDKLHFATVITRLEDFRDVNAVATQRYFSIHRLALRHGPWEIAATESYLYSGVGRRFEPSLSNPFNIFSLSWRNEAQDGNLGLGLETSFRSRKGTLAAHIFLDDLQIDRCDEICKEPSSYGLTLTAEGLPLAGDQRWFASYARVSYLTYRTPTTPERYSSFNIGLGQGFSDFDEVRVGLDLALVPRTPLRFYVARRRQGEGDYRDAFPLPADYATTPGIFGGIVSNVVRLGVTGASRWSDLELSGDVGVNKVDDDVELRGVSVNGFQARVKLSWEPRWSVAF